MIAGWDIVIAVAVFAVVLVAVLPFVPLWAAYAFTAAYAYTRLLDVLQHGATTKRLVVLATSTMIAALCGTAMWRRRKEGRSGTDVK
jgi:membrane protein implicated in regulation of membrane protease activity